MKKKLYALVDGNNFFVSCERVFHPSVRKKPVVVLSSNDGCIISRSDEAKALGIPMGAPAFKWRQVFERQNVRIFSCNFELYGDMSERMMKTLLPFGESMEIYSIDEAFLSLPKSSVSFQTEYGREIRETVRRCTGLPVSVGIASTKTLAKIASEWIKRNPHLQGVLNLEEEDIDRILDHIPVGDVWGIGRNLSALLRNNAIYTAKDLKYADSRWVQKNLHVLGLRTQRELNGEPCIRFEETPQPKKSIICSRTFSKTVLDFRSLEEALSSFTSRAAEKLREEKSLASVVQVYIGTSRYAENKYINTKTVFPKYPTSFTPDLIAVAIQGLKELFRPGFYYKKAGICLSGIRSDQRRQLDLFCENDEERFQEKLNLMKAVDRANARFGKGAVRFLSEGIEQNWKTRCDLKSPAYTTRWKEILRVQI